VFLRAMASKARLSKGSTEELENEQNKGFRSIEKQLKDGFAAVIQTIEGLKMEVKRANSRLDVLESKEEASSEQIWELRQAIETVKIRQRKFNLVIVGLAEAKAETEEQLRESLKFLFRESMEIKEVDIPIDVCYRIGNRHESSGNDKYWHKPLNIRVHLHNESDRNRIWRSRGLLHEKKLPVFVNEDLPFSALEKRKALRQEAGMARSLGKQVKWAGNRLIINGSSFGIGPGGTLMETAQSQGHRVTRETPTAYGQYGHNDSATQSSDRMQGKGGRGATRNQPPRRGRYHPYSGSRAMTTTRLSQTQQNQTGINMEQDDTGSSEGDPPFVDANTGGTYMDQQNPSVRP